MRPFVLLAGLRPGSTRVIRAYYLPAARITDQSRSAFAAAVAITVSSSSCVQRSPSGALPNPSAVTSIPVRPSGRLSIACREGLSGTLRMRNGREIFAQ